MGLSSASVSRTTKSCPARRPTARTSVGSMPGSACRPSSAPPLTARRSTTSSTVKPRTFPASSSSSTVVPSTPPAAGSGWRRARHPSTTVTKVPRTFTRPATTEGAPGIRVAPSRGRISRTRSASVAQRSWPTRKMSSRTTPASLIRSEEAKILQGVALSKQTRIGRRFRERRKQIGGPLGPQHDLLLRDRVGEREQRGVQQLSRGARLQPLGGAALAGGDASATSEGVVAVPHDRVPHMGEMHADLVRAAGAERDAQEIGLGPARDDYGMGGGVALAGEHGPEFAVLGMAHDGRLDRHRALRDVAPGHRGVDAGDLAPLDQPGQPAVRLVGLGHQEQSRGVAVQAVHDAGPAPPPPGPPPGPALRQRGAPRSEEHPAALPSLRRLVSPPLLYKKKTHTTRQTPQRTATALTRRSPT